MQVQAKKVLVYCEYIWMVFEEEFSGRRLGGRPEYFKGVGE